MNIRGKNKIIEKPSHLEVCLYNMKKEEIARAIIDNVEIFINNKKYYIGSFVGWKEAREARLRAEKDFFGEFRSKNK